MTAEGRRSARREAEAAYGDVRSVVAGGASSGTGVREVIDPTTASALGAIRCASTDDLTTALEAAHSAARAWAARPAEVRRRLLETAALLLHDRTDVIAATIALELGKPLAQARAEVALACEIIRWNAQEGTRPPGRVLDPANPVRQRIVTYEPVGPVAAISSWNAPILTLSRKMSGALAAGCPVIAKPAEQTPATAVHLTRALLDAGIPEDTAQLVMGDPGAVADRLVTSPVIRVITFTGSTPVGRQLAAAAGSDLKRTVLELGGHAPVVVLPDVDVPELATAAVRAAYRNGGQVCTSPSRFLVHQDIHDRFVEAFVAAAAALEVGDPFDDVDMGPVAHERRIAWLAELCEDAAAKGLPIPAGGTRLSRSGWFWSPTVILDPRVESRAMAEEPFGPVATITPIDGVEQALDIANGLPLGLAAYVFTNDAVAMRRLASGLDCGAIAVNHWQVSSPDSPFGGRRDSGHGIEGGSEGLAAFRQQRFVDIR